MSTPARGVWKWLPGLRVARDYERSWLPRDIAAGLVLTALLVPAGMGYAEASGLPPITGLYATIVPLVAYAIFGPSRILVLGPDSSLAPLIAASIVPLAAGDPDEAIVLAGMLSILAGGICIVAGLARFGFITDLLSKPVRYGYMNGIALVVIVSQLPKLFGFSVDADGVIDGTRAFVDGVADGETNRTALVIGVAGIAVILACKRWAKRVPGVLVCVVGATVVVAVFDLAARRGVSVVGELPRGLPSFSFPSVDAGDLGTLAVGAVGIALVSFADTSVLSRTFALRHGDDVDPNQEMMALGAANVAAGVFQGFPVSSSSSRTPVAEQAGSRSQLTGLVGAGAIAVMLVAVPGLVRDLPDSALAAVVITAAFGLFEVAGVRRLWAMRRSEFALSMACFLGVAVLGVLQGIFIAVGLALANFVQRAWRPYDAVLGRVDGMKGYHDVSRNPEAKQVPGLLLYRWDAPLFFANADVFEERVVKAIAHASMPVRRVVVTAEPMTDIDTSAADVLERLHGDLVAEDVELTFAEVKSPVMDQLERYGLLDLLGRHSFFPTIGTAVKDYVRDTGVDWVDWEDTLADRAGRDWVAWHGAYEDDGSSLSRRLAVVRRRVGEVLDAARAGRALRILSLCAGEGRDVLPELAARPQVDVQAVLVELDPELAERARRAADGRDGVRVRVGDAGDVSSFDDVLPVDLLLLCGVFGNVSDDDIRRTIATVPAMLVPGGTVIWTRGRFGDERDLRPLVRRWFVEAGLDEVAFDGEPESFGVGVARRPLDAIAPIDLPSRLFTFVARAGDPVTIGPSRRAKLSAGGRGMPTMLRTVAVVAYQGVLADESTAFVDVLSRLPGARLVVVGRRIGVVAGPGGAQWVEARFPEVDPDVVVVPGGLGSHRHAEIAEWIRHVRPRWVLSSSTGSAMLAAGGLLRGRRAATHWLAAPLLERHGVEATTDRLVVDGPFVTCAGLASTFEAADVVVRAVGGDDLVQRIHEEMRVDALGERRPCPPSRTRYRPRTRRHAPPPGAGAAEAPSPWAPPADRDVESGPASMR